MLIFIILGWFYYCIDYNGALGTATAIDQYHNPHIVYYSSNNLLTHTWWNGNTWQYENITSVASYHNCGPSIIFDNTNRLHIAFYSNNERLSYAYFDGTWHIEPVDTTYRTGDYCDISLDQNGNPCIAYYRYLGLFSGYLRLARKSGGQWQIIELTNEYGGFHANLEIDSQNRLHITDCTSWSGGDLRYLVYDGFSWQFEKPVLTNVGGYNSLVLDNLNRPHISFYWADGTNFDLRYTNKNSGAWQVYLVDHGLQLFKRGWDNHILIDDTQTLHIAYHCHNEEFVKYARGSGNSWNTQIVDTIGGYSSNISIARDGSDIFISYYNENTTDLWLAATRELLGINEHENKKASIPPGIFTNGPITIPPNSSLYNVSGMLVIKNSTPSPIREVLNHAGVYYLKNRNSFGKVIVIK